MDSYNELNIKIIKDKTSKYPREHQDQVFT